MHRLLLLVSAATALSPAAVALERATSVLEEVVVVAARMPRPVQDVVGTVDVVSHEDLRESLAMRTADVVRYIPGVSVTQDGTRFGDSGFTIRGLSGNRVVDDKIRNDTAHREGPGSARICVPELESGTRNRSYTARRRSAARLVTIISRTGATGVSDLYND